MTPRWTLSIVAALTLAGSVPAHAATIQITVENLVFSPTETSAKVGDTVGPKAPGKPDVVAIPIGFADQLELEVRKTLLHAGDQCVDAVKAVAVHQGVDIFRVGGPVRS